MVKAGSKGMVRLLWDRRSVTRIEGDGPEQWSFDVVGRWEVVEGVGRV